MTTPINTEFSSLTVDGKRVYGGIAVSEDILIYLDPILGLDTNEGTIINPIRTFTEAFKRLPAVWTRKCRLIPAPGIYDETTLPDRFWRFGTGVGPDAEPLLIQGSFTTLLTSVTTAPGSNTANIIDSSQSVVADQYRGSFIRILDGPQAGEVGMIRETLVGGSFFLNSVFSGVIGAGVSYRIENPAVVIKIPNVHLSGPGTGIGFYGLRFEGVVGVSTFFSVTNNTIVYANAVQYVTPSIASIIAGGGSEWRARVSASVGFNPWPDVISTQNQFVGCYFETGNNNSTITAVTRGVIDGGWVVFRSRFAGFQTSIVNIQFDQLNGALSQIGDSSHLVFAGQGAARARSRNVRWAVNTGSNCFLLAGEINNVSGDAFTIDRASAGVILNMIGSGSTGYGIRLLQGSNAVIPAGSTLTGALGDLGIGDFSASYADLLTGPITDLSQLCRARP